MLVTLHYEGDDYHSNDALFVRDYRTTAEA